MKDKENFMNANVEPSPSDNPIQFTDPSQGDSSGGRSLSKKTIFLIVIGALTVVAILYVIKIRPVQVCAQKARTDTAEVFDAPGMSGKSSVKDRESTEKNLFYGCLRNKGIAIKDVTALNPVRLLGSFFFTGMIIFGFLFLFKNRLESSRVVAYRAVGLSILLSICSIIGGMFGIIGIIIASFVNFYIVMTLLHFSFITTLLFLLGIDFVYVISSILLLSASK